MSDFKDENQRYTFNEILRDPSRKRGDAENLLAFLFRNILFENRIGVDDWEVMLNRYFRAVYQDDRKTAAQEKINLSRSIAKDRLTWQRFVEALEVFGFDEMEFVVTLRNRGDEKGRSFRGVTRNRYKQQVGISPLREKRTESTEDGVDKGEEESK